VCACRSRRRSRCIRSILAVRFVIGHGDYGHLGLTRLRISTMTGVASAMASSITQCVILLQGLAKNEELMMLVILPSIHCAGLILCLELLLDSSCFT